MFLIGHYLCREQKLLSFLKSHLKVRQCQGQVQQGVGEVVIAQGLIPPRQDTPTHSTL
jgi:hypothetical protein